jgi:hexosaminidase
VEVYPEIFADHAGGKTLLTTRTEHGEPLQYRELMCASNPLCMEANERLLKEIADMFPDSPYIHIGGDEAQIKQWEQCDDCTRYMREQGIADVYELYSRFVGRTAAYVLSLGRTPIVWEGFPKKGHEHVPKETVVVAWESYYHMVYDLLEEGFRVINASWEPLYIVPSFTRRWSPFDILKWNVYRWQHWWPKSEAFLDPITVAPTDRVLGATLCSWEQSFELEIGALMENLAALSERTWNVRRSVTDEEYTEMYQAQRLRLARLIQDR